MSNSMSRLILILIVATLTGACSGVTVKDYSSVGPKLELPAFFNGKLTAHGIIKDRSGEVLRYFNAELVGSWNDGVGRLQETFVFDDASQTRREWHLTPDGAGGYIGTAEDVIGASRVLIAGNSAFLDYVLRVPYGDSNIDLRIDDRMYLVSERVLINESIMTKWGFRVGNVTLVIEKQT